MLGECGLVPIRAELEAQAILRVIERRLNSLDVMWRDASLTIIDVGGSNTHMYVVQSQRLQFIRGVKFGTNLLAATISDALEISTDEAEALLGSARSTLDSAGVLSVEFEEGITKVNLAEPLEKLVREFTRLLRYFRSLHPERSYAGILDHLILCGGVSGLQGFPEFLSKRLSLRVELARPIAGTIAKVNAETFQSISNRQEAFTVVMGLALSGLSSHRESLTGGVKREFFWTRAA
jgi:Tfp pilus assembly PilM family ATPase